MTSRRPRPLAHPEHKRPLQHLDARRRRFLTDRQQTVVQCIAHLDTKSRDLRQSTARTCRWLRSARVRSSPSVRNRIPRSRPNVASSPGARPKRSRHSATCHCRLRFPTSFPAAAVPSSTGVCQQPGSNVCDASGSCIRVPCSSDISTMSAVTGARRNASSPTASRDRVHHRSVAGADRRLADAARADRRFRIGQAERLGVHLGRDVEDRQRLVVVEALRQRARRTAGRRRTSAAARGRCPG